MSTEYERDVISALSDAIANLSDDIKTLMQTALIVFERVDIAKLLNDADRQNIQQCLGQLEVVLTSHALLSKQLLKSIDARVDVVEKYTISVQNMSNAVEQMHRSVTEQIVDNKCTSNQLKTVVAGLKLVEEVTGRFQLQLTEACRIIQKITRTHLTKNRAIMSFLERITPYILAIGAALIAWLSTK